MKRKVSKLIVVLCLVQTARADGFNPSVDELLATGLKLVQIETVGGEEPTCEAVQAPEGCWGISAVNKNKVSARMSIQQGGVVLYDSGEYQNDVSGVQVSLRGNQSALTDKKAYKLKLQKKADLLLRGDKTYNDKQWALIKDEESNLISLNSLVGFKVGELAGLQWLPQLEYVNVVMNGDYKGVYMLMESVKEGSRRLDVSKDSGYIIEYDSYWWNEDLCLEEGRWYYYAPMRYTFKYPDADDITQEQIDFIQGRVNDMELAIEEGTYEQQIDVESFAAWLMAHDILGTADNGGSNIFMTLHDNGEETKFCMGNLWDMDSIERMEGEWSRVHIMWGFYFRHLFNSQNMAFMAAFMQKWDEMSPSLVEQMDAFLDDFAASEQGLGLDRSMQLDAQRWGYTAKTLEGEVSKNKLWFKTRKAWLDENVPVECTPYVNYITDVKHPKVLRTNPSEQIYDLWGRKASPRSRGLLLKGGRKYYF